jgi:hypothetical protein
VFVAFGILYAKCMRHIVICGLTSSTVLFTLAHRGHDFRKKNQYKICVLIFCTTRYSCQILINPLNAELNPIYHLLALLGAHHILHVSRIRVKLEISREFRNIHWYKIHENQSNRSRVVPCRRTNRRTDMMKLIVNFTVFRRRLKYVLICEITS